MKRPDAALALLSSIFAVLLLCSPCHALGSRNAAGGGADKGDVGWGKPADRPDLLPNGGFEALGREGHKGLPDGWRVVPGAESRGEASLDHLRARSGRYSLKLEPGKKNTIEGFGVFIALDPEKISGRDVTVSGHAWVEGIGDGVAGVLLKTDRMNWAIAPNTGKKGFVHFSKTFAVPEDIPEAVLLVLVSGTSGTVWFDDLSVEAVRPGPSKDPGHGSATAGESSGLDRINTHGWQDSAFISPDGRELYYAYSPYPQKVFMDVIKGRLAEDDVKVKGPVRPGSHGTLLLETYKAEMKADGTWGRPVLLDINSGYSLGSAKTSLDGKELYFSIRDYPSNYGVTDIYVSKKLEDGTWGRPVNLGPNVNSRYLDDTPCLSPDGRSLYFARNRLGEDLGWEIMVSKRTDGGWTRAERLPPPVNGLRPEKTANHQPFITADGKELYFTRVLHLYRSVRNHDGTWGAPERVFKREAGHASVTADGRRLYFITAGDREALRLHNWTIWYSVRQKDGSWGEPRPVD